MSIKGLSVPVLLIFLLVKIGMAEVAVREKITLGKWTVSEFEGILSESSNIDGPGKRIEFLSGKFLNTPYMDTTLIGDVGNPEVFIVNFEGMDCFTFIDYVEAMRVSGSLGEFKEKLKNIRYRAGMVSYENRNHFFTDWRDFNKGLVLDVTEEVGKERTKKARKMLNRKRGGVNLLPGIDYRQREIRYIPSDVIDDAVIDSLMTGDYVGIYTRKQGLDVSHVGIVIKERGKVYFRHASSDRKHRKVINQDFKKYMEGKPGIVVLRPLNLAVSAFQPRDLKP